MNNLDKDFHRAVELDDEQDRRRSSGLSKSGSAAEQPEPHQDPASPSVQGHMILEGKKTDRGAAGGFGASNT